MEREEKQFIKARTVLWVMLFFGTLLNLEFIYNYNFAIVDMMYVLRNANNLHNQTSCDVPSNVTSLIPNCNVNSTMLVTTGKLITFSIEKRILDFFNQKYENDGFHWDESVQNTIISSFSWITWLAGIPGGVIARRYGAKICYGYATLMTSCLCFLIPMAAYVDYKLLILIRITQGFLYGIAQSFNIIAFWVPPNERSQFVIAYIGGSVSIFIFYPIFGYIIAFSSWEYIFHLCGILGFCWFAAWQFLVYDTPAQHPRINKSEKEYIEKSLGDSVSTNKKISIPWKSILTDIKCWSVIIADVGAVCAVVTLLLYTPTYFKVVHKLDVKSTGIITGLPYLTKLIYAVVTSALADFFLKSKKFSRTFVRKVATFSSHILHGLLGLAFAYSGYNTTVCILFLIVSTTMHGSLTAGSYASFFDISPNYSSILFGITLMFRAWITVAMSSFAGYITYKNQTMDGWRIVFTASSTVAICSGVFYLIFFNANIRPWNSQLAHVGYETKIDVELSNIKPNFKENDDLEKIQTNEEETIPFLTKK